MRWSPTSPSRPTSTELHDLARRVERLCPSPRDPERFFIDKSDLAAELRRLANTLSGARRA